MATSLWVSPSQARKTMPKLPSPRTRTTRYLPMAWGIGADNVEEVLLPASDVTDRPSAPCRGVTVSPFSGLMDLISHWVLREEFGRRSRACEELLHNHLKMLLPVGLT